MKKRVMIFIDITNKCNECCPICFKNASLDGSTIHSDTLDTILAALVPVRRKVQVMLFGGEPTLEPELCKRVIIFCNKHNIPINLFTNGWWINNSNYDWIFSKEYRIDAIFLSVNKWIPNCINNLKVLGNKCIKCKITLAANIIDNFGDAIDICKDIGCIPIPDTITLNHKCNYDDNSKRTRSCNCSGINILINGDTYLACDLLQCKLGGIKNLVLDANRYNNVYNQPQRKEEYITNEVINCTWNANKLIDTEY